MTRRSLDGIRDSRLRRAISRTVGTLLDIGLNTRYAIEVRGLENYTRMPSTLVVCNHRRDTDGPIIGCTLMGRRGLKTVSSLPNFVAREDLFRRAFLWNYLENWPTALRDLLAPINPGAALRYFRTYPIRRVPERSLGEILDDVHQMFGNVTLSHVLKPEWVKRFESVAGPAPRPLRIQDVRGRVFRPLLCTRYGLSKMRREFFTAIKPFERTVIEQHLAVFTALLERGEVVQLAPEGGTSQDGRFARLRAGLYILLNRVRVPVRVLPVGITYDFMTNRREKVFVNVGSELTDLAGLDRRTTDTRVAEAILAQNTVTASQLASKRLLNLRPDGGVLTAHELVEYVAAEARRCVKAGLFVDPRLLDAPRCERRIGEYLDYCLRVGTLTALDERTYRIANFRIATNDRYTPYGVIDYLNNEFASLTRLRPAIMETP